MALNYLNILNDVSDIINSEYQNNTRIYEEMFCKIKTTLPCVFLEVYFLDSSNYTKKFSTLNQDIKTLNENCFDLIDKKKENTFFVKDNDYYKVFSKLSIKNSVFGFIVMQIKSKPNKDQLTILNTYATIYSYIIKDYELSNVFQMQLSALQKAVIENREAKHFIEKQNKKLTELDGIKNNFLSSVTHELRTPLNAIIGFSQVLDSKIFGDLNPKQDEYIKDIQASGVHLLNMINEILDFSKIEGKAVKIFYSKFNPFVIISEITNILLPLSQKKNIKIIIEDNYQNILNTDCQKFQQIIYNLLSNAIKFTNQNGKIIIKLYSQNNKFIMEFQDNGIGIEKKNHNKIFKKFVYLNNIHSPSESSTGLGLAITKELVKILKGKITLESTLGFGSKFVVTLPIAREGQ